MMVDGSKLSYEDACRISGVPEDRGYVTLREVVNAINEKLGLELVASDQIGYKPIPKRNCSYLLTMYYDGNQVGEPECQDIIGIYTTKENAKEAAKYLEASGNVPPRYTGYSITEYELDSINGALCDV